MTLFDVIGNVLLKGMELGYDDNFQANVNLVTGSIRICGKVIMDRYKIIPCTFYLSDGTSIKVTDDMELLPEHLKENDAFQVVEKLYTIDPYLEKHQKRKDTCMPFQQKV